MESIRCSNVAPAGQCRERKKHNAALSHSCRDLYSRGFANVGLRYIKAGAVDFAIFGRGSGSYEDISHASLVELGR
jgi:hypothetical protein